MRILTLILVFLTLDFPSQASAQSPESPSLASGMVTGLMTGVAVGGGSVAALCAFGGLDDDPINPAGCFLVGGGWSVLPGLAAGVALSRPDGSSARGRLRTMLYGTLGGLADGAVADAFSGGDRASDYYLYGAVWGTGVGLVTALVGPSVRDVVFPSVRRTTDGGVELSLRLEVR